MIETTDLAPARASASAASDFAGGLASLTAIEITAANIEWANATAKQIREYRKGLDAEEKSGTAPLLAVVEKIRSWFRAPKQVCDEVYRHLTEGAARAIADGKRQQMALAAEAVATGAGALEIQRAVEAVVPKPTGSRTLVYYSARIIDASKVPREFLCVDQKALDAHAREVKDAFAVPGVELVRDEKVVPL